MISKLLKGESGYSLIEVMVAIILLSIAIIPMVGMFDAGLRGINSSGDYDQARALANQQMEQVKSLPYLDAAEQFPDGDTLAPATGGAVTSTPRRTDAAFPGFEYAVTKQFVKVASNGDIVASNDAGGEADVGLMKVTVTVYWEGNDYSTTGLVSI